MFSLGSSVGNDVKWRSSLERALGTWDSVSEWADYISFLSRLEKSIKSRHNCNGSELPLAQQISETLSRCLEPSLPAGVHQTCINVYATVFTTIGDHKLCATLHTWLPGLLPVISYAAFNVKPLVLDLLRKHILSAVSTSPGELRELAHPLLLSLLPSIEDESSDCFKEILNLISILRTNLKDDQFYWQCVYLCILNSPDCRLGALILFQRADPSITDATLFCRAICNGLKDSNVLVQRGYLDVLAKMLPLNSEILQSDVENFDKIALCACCTILRRDMSLNRRLWVWLLGPEPETGDSTNTTNSNTNQTRFDYLKTYGSQTLVRVLLNYFQAEPTSFYTITRGLMDRWEIGVTVTHSLLIPILERSRTVSKQLGEVETGAKQVFDNLEGDVVWSTAIKLLETDVSLITFMVQNFDIKDEEMIKIHIPQFIAFVLAKFDLNDEIYLLINSLLQIIEHFEIPQRPETELSDSELIKRVSEFYNNGVEQYQEEQVSSLGNDVEPIPAKELTWYLLRLASQVVLNQDSPKLLNDILDLIPEAPGLDIETPIDNTLVNHLTKTTTEHVRLFTHLESTMTLAQSRQFVQRFIENLVMDTDTQVDRIKWMWKVDDVIGKKVVTSSLSSVLSNSQFSVEQRAKLFCNIWLNSMDVHNIAELLEKPMLLFLDLADLDTQVFSAYFQSNVVRTGTSNKLLKTLIDKLDTEIANENQRDDYVFAYTLEKTVFVLGFPDVRTVYVNRFATLMCTLLLKWFDESLISSRCYPNALALAQLTALDSRVKDGKLWLKRFVDALTNSVIYKDTYLHVSLMKFVTAAIPMLDTNVNLSVFLGVCVSRLCTEVDYDVFYGLLSAFLECSMEVEEDLLLKIVSKTDALKSSQQENVLCSDVIHLVGTMESIITAAERIVKLGPHSTSGSSSSSGGITTALTGFQVESPEDRARAEQNKLSFLRCVNICVSQSCKLWMDLQTYTEINPPSNQDMNALHSAGRLKTRIRKLLSFAYKTQPPETIATVSEYTIDLKQTVRLVHLFEGSQNVHTVETFALLVNKRPEFLGLFGAYLNSLESDVLGDVWPNVQQFISSSNSSLVSRLEFLVDCLTPRIKHLRFKNYKRAMKDYSEVYSKILVQDAHDAGIPLVCKALRTINSIFGDSDKSSSLLTKLFNIFIPSTIDIVRQTELVSVFADEFKVSGSPNTKVWTKPFGDLLFETDTQESFIPISVLQSMQLKKVVATWVQCEREWFKDFESKLTIYGSSTGGLFGWSGSKTIAYANLKRLAYFVICADPAVLALNTFKLTNHLTTIWTENIPIVLTLIRACMMRSSSHSLIIFAAFRLRTALNDLCEKEEDILTGNNAQILVEACKLIDLALVIQPPEFQMYEWLFVPNACDPPHSVTESKALLAKIYSKIIHPSQESSTQVVSDDFVVNNDTTDSTKLSRPLLPKRATINDILPMISQLVKHSYRDACLMKAPDYEYLEEWILSDLFM